MGVKRLLAPLAGNRPALVAFAVSVVIVNLLADAAQVLLDPRLRTA